MTDIVFVFPAARGNRPQFKPHLGVAYLQAALRHSGIASAQYLEKKPGSAWDVARAILALAPRVTGFTVYDSNFGACAAIARCLKSLNPDVWVIFGGPTATFSDQEILATSPDVDLCLRGEMEVAGPRIMEQVLGGSGGSMLDAIDRIPGVSRLREGEPYTTGLAPLVPDSPCDTKCPLDLLASPYLDGAILQDGSAGILTGRGCNQNCVYCCFAALGRKKLRLHSIDRVIAELEFISHRQKQNKNPVMINIHDDTFSLLPERAKELCREIAQRKLGLHLTCITRADRVDGELLELMKRAGFTAVAFGLESAVPHVLRAIGKVREPRVNTEDYQAEIEFVEKVRQSVHKAKELGFITGVSIILGLPAETIDNARATVDFVKNLPIDYYMHNILQVFPGTPLWANHGEFGIATVKGPDGLYTTTRYPFDPYKISPAEKSVSNKESAYVKLLAAASAFGCGSALPHMEELSTVVIKSSRLSDEIVAWLRNHIRIGGIVIQHYEDRIGPEDDVVAYDRAKMVEAMVPLRFYIQLITNNVENGSHTWQVNSEMAEIGGAYSPDLARLRLETSPEPLLAWIEGRSVGCDLCDPMNHPDSSRSFNDLLSRMAKLEASKMLSTLKTPPMLVYPGQFSVNRAPCRNLSRIEIDTEGAIRVCAHGSPLATIHDDFTVARKQLQNHLTQAEDKGGGNLRCPFPPANVKSSVYFEERSLGGFNLINFYSKVNLLFQDTTEEFGQD